MGKLLSFKSFSVPLLVIFVFSFSSFFCFSYGDPHFQNSQATPTSGEIQKGTKRILLQEEQSDETPVNSSYLILAAKRTHRRDPLDDFKKYTGGWNISEKHYWASVGFTAVPPFVFAAIWFVGFGLCLSLICLCYCCCRREPYGYSRIAYALSLILLILFTVVAIVGCVVLYTGQEKFHNSISKTLTYVVNTANSTGEKLRDVSEYLAAAKKIQVDQFFLSSNVQTDIDEIQTKINSSATTLTERTVDNSEDIHDIVDSVRLALIIISAVMLSLTFIGFLLSLFGKKKLVYILVIIGWILVTGTFILCGVFLLLHNVTADSCIAMNQWVQNPTAHTALDDILPCVDNATALETLSKTKEVTSQLVNVVNRVITNVSNINFPPSFKSLYFNQSGPLLPILCNPFKPDFTNRTCAPGEIDLSNATKVWKNYTCQVSSDGICVTTGRLTPTFYDQMAASINVSYGLYHYGPFLVELQDCTFVRETFIVINREHCPGLRRYSKWVYIGMVMVSAAVLLSLVFWVIYGRERRHRVYTKAVIGHNFEGDKGT